MHFNIKNKEIRFSLENILSEEEKIKLNKLENKISDLKNEQNRYISSSEEMTDNESTEYFDVCRKLIKFENNYNSLKFITPNNIDDILRHYKYIADINKTYALAEASRLRMLYRTRQSSTAISEIHFEEVKVNFLDQIMKVIQNLSALKNSNLEKDFELIELGALTGRFNSLIEDITLFYRNHKASTVGRHNGKKSFHRRGEALLKIANDTWSVYPKVPVTTLADRLLKYDKEKHTDSPSFSTIKSWLTTSEKNPKLKGRQPKIEFDLVIK